MLFCLLHDLETESRQNYSLTSVFVSNLTYPESVYRTPCVLDTWKTGKIWCLGSNSGSKSVYSFDGAQFTKEKSLMATLAQYDGGATIVNGLIYVSEMFGSYIHTYNIITGEHNSQFSRHPESLYEMKLTYNGEDIIYCGNTWTPISSYKKIYEFNITSKGYTLFPILPVEPHRLGALVYYNNRIVLIGGENLVSSRVKYINLNPLNNAFTTSEYQHIFPNNLRNNGVITLDNGIFYSLGGVFTGHDIYIYDIMQVFGFKSSINLQQEITEQIACVLDVSYKIWCIGNSPATTRIFESNQIAQKIPSIEPSESSKKNSTVQPISNPTMTSFNPTNTPTIKPSINPTSIFMKQNETSNIHLIDIVLITLASILIFLVSVGIIYFCYKQQSNDSGLNNITSVNSPMQLSQIVSNVSTNSTLNYVPNAVVIKNEFEMKSLKQNEEGEQQLQDIEMVFEEKNEYS